MVYGIGPYIADYPEQVLLACIVQNWCPRWYVVSSFPSRHDVPDIFHSRCTAQPDNLDGGNPAPRTMDHFNLASELLGLGELWDGYGYVADLVVSIYPFVCWGDIA